MQAMQEHLLVVPVGPSSGRSNVLSLGHPGLTKNPGVCHPGKPVQRENVPLTHYLFPLHPDIFIEQVPHRSSNSTSL